MLQYAHSYHQHTHMHWRSLTLLFTHILPCCHCILYYLQILLTTTGFGVGRVADGVANPWIAGAEPGDDKWAIANTNVNAPIAVDTTVYDDSSSTATAAPSDLVIVDDKRTTAPTDTPVPLLPVVDPSAAATPTATPTTAAATTAATTTTTAVVAPPLWTGGDIVLQSKPQFGPNGRYVSTCIITK